MSFESLSQMLAGEGPLKEGPPTKKGFPVCYRKALIYSIHNRRGGIAPSRLGFIDIYHRNGDLDGGNVGVLMTGNNPGTDGSGRGYFPV